MKPHIITNITVNLSIWDRLKVFAGFRVNVEVRIETKDENVEVVASESTAWVNPIFKRKEIGMSHTVSA